MRSLLLGWRIRQSCAGGDQDTGLTRHPNLDDIPGFERTKGNAKVKRFGDILVSHKGKQVVIDVMFSSRVHKTMQELEEDKTRQYRINRKFDASGFIPFIVTSNGAWGDQMTKYFKETTKGRRSDRIVDEYQRKYLRYAKEMISFAVCQANWLYIQRVRYVIWHTVSSNSEARDPKSIVVCVTEPIHLQGM